LLIAGGVAVSAHAGSLRGTMEEIEIKAEKGGGKFHCLVLSSQNWTLCLRYHRLFPCICRKINERTACEILLLLFEVVTKDRLSSKESNWQHNFGMFIFVALRPTYSPSILVMELNAALDNLFQPPTHSIFTKIYSY